MLFSCDKSNTSKILYCKIECQQVGHVYVESNLVLYIRYVFKISKRHLTFIKRPGRHLISFKILISSS